uniref:DUF2922 domain-containing protein n=1 Tax=Ezakiella massiliensis TaxID=1852374 RepID=UPI00094E1A2E|nr:DUF2922 domain-containing protein [Ezakiella massiliensis]
MKKRLQLKFENANKQSFSISLSEFKEGLTGEAIKQETAKILGSNTLMYKDSQAQSLLEANVITIETQKLV